VEARRVVVQGQPLDVAAETDSFFLAGDAGAVVTFVGLCRSEGGRLRALELEHYPGMAETEIERIADEALRRWPLHRVSIVHRFGLVTPGEPIVFVAAASEHRQAAFPAAEFLMDFMKTRAPFWKREHMADGSIGDWVAAEARDDDAAERWRRG
jgi:molybdopterin synthase catalytic subunit